VQNPAKAIELLRWLVRQLEVPMLDPFETARRR
jgi:hypothetical protein